MYDSIDRIPDTRPSPLDTLMAKEELREKNEYREILQDCAMKSAVRFLSEDLRKKWGFYIRDDYSNVEVTAKHFGIQRQTFHKEIKRIEDIVATGQVLIALIEYQDKGVKALLSDWTVLPCSALFTIRPRNPNWILRTWSVPRTKAFDEICKIAAPHRHCITRKEGEMLDEMFPVLIEKACQDILDKFKNNRIKFRNDPIRIIRDTELVFMSSRYLDYKAQDALKAAAALFSSSGIMRNPFIERQVKVCSAYASLDGALSDYCRGMRDDDSYSLLEILTLSIYCGDTLRNQNFAATLVAGNRSRIRTLIESSIKTQKSVNDRFLSYNAECLKSWRYIDNPDLTEMCINWSLLLRKALDTPSAELDEKLNEPFSELLSENKVDARIRRLCEKVNASWA